MCAFANPVCLALDTPDPVKAVSLAQDLAGLVGCLKIGLEFFCAHGVSGYEKIAAQGIPIFLDLKLHDIPNTVAGTLRALAKLKPAPAIINVHASGGEAMMRAARQALADIPDGSRPKLVAVTILTSLDHDDLTAIGYDMSGGGGTLEHAVALAGLAARADLDGVVCSPRELSAIRSAYGHHFLTVVPGIRPAGGNLGDQKRTATPAAAIRDGADLLVIGRPITDATDPATAARDILAEMEHTQGSVEPAAGHAS